LIDEGERFQRRPEAHLGGLVDNGVGDEQGIQFPEDDSAEWLSIDEPWALKLESIALQKVDQHLDGKGLSEDIRRSICRRLIGLPGRGADAQGRGSEAWNSGGQVQQPVLSGARVVSENHPR